MTGRRIAVTGAGVVCPAGNSPAEVLDRIRTGRSCLSPLTIGDGDQAVSAVVGSATLPDGIDPRPMRRLDRFSRLALTAASRAWQDARSPTVRSHAAGVIVGNGFGGVQVFSDQVGRLEHRGPGRVSPLLIPTVIPSAAAAAISQELGFTGISLTISNACASGATAIGEAAIRIRTGELDVAIAGGVEAPLVPIAVAGFTNMRALADTVDGCAPFSKQRSGFALAEGAVFLVLEEWERAINRRVAVYGELVGYGSSADAHHVTDPEPEGKGAEQAFTAALRQAGIAPAQVDYVNAHATGTRAGDRAEAIMLERALGAKGRERVRVSSTKGLTGHLLGAAGALEALVTLLTIQSGLLPANLPCPEPEPDLNLVLESGTQAPVRVAVSNSFGFGGLNAVLAFAAADLGVDKRPGGP